MSWKPPSSAPRKSIPLRLIEVPWTCRQTGDCCRAVPVVTMSTDEQQLLLMHPLVKDRVLPWQPDPQPGFVQLKAQPCPLLGANNLCTVHEIRPYNCRRFICGRVDVHSEPYEQGGPLGCYNLSDRIETSERFRHHAETTQRKAQPWALEHGWRRDP